MRKSSPFRSSRTGTNSAAVVAMDIVGYSRFRNDEPWLVEVRKQFTGAVEATDLYQRTLANAPAGQGLGVAQYLGDELRFAFFETSRPEAEEFVIRVFEGLKDNAVGFTLRAALTEGPVEKAKLYDCTYLIGDAITRVARMLGEISAEGCLIADEKLRKSACEPVTWGKETIWRQHFYTPQATASLPIPEHRTLDGLMHFLVAIGVKSDQANVQRTAVKQLERLIRSGAGEMGLKVNGAIGEKSSALISVGPAAVLVAICSTNADETLQFILALNEKYRGDFATAIAVSSGKLSVSDIPWIGRIFEGKAAIEATRIFTKLGPGELGFYAPQFDDYWKKFRSRFELVIDGMILGKHKDEQYPIFRNESFLRREIQSYAFAGATNSTVDSQLDDLDPTSKTKRFKDSRSALAYFGQLCEHWNGWEQLEAAITDDMLPALERWKLRIIKTNLVLPYYLLAEQTRRTSSGIHKGLLTRIAMNTLDRKEAAIKALDSASQSVVAVSVVNDDQFWTDGNYLEKNIEAKGRIPDGAFRRLLITTPSQKASTVLRQAVEQQLAARILLRIVPNKELERIAKQEECTWTEFRNLLIVDNQIATRSDADSKTEDGEVFWKEGEAKSEIDEELKQFNLLWNYLVTYNIGDPRNFLALQP